MSAHNQRTDHVGTGIAASYWLISAGLVTRCRHMFVMACCVLFASQLQAQDNNTLTAASLVTTETAEYRGRLQGQQIVNGSFSLHVVRRGEGPSLIDWSLVNIAMGELAWEKQALIGGTTSDQRIVLMTQRDSDVLTGRWSALGTLIGKTTAFDFQLPPALNNRLLLDLPLALRLDCKQGLVQQGDVDEERATRLWILELGGVSTATVMVSPSVKDRTATPPRYEIETEFRARRDGIFVRADLTLEGPFPAGLPLKIQIPPTLELQSISLQGGFSPGGMNLRFERDPENPHLVLVQLDSLTNETAIALRIRGFEAWAWKNSRAMPRLRVAGALETKRTLVLRVEPPLELQEIESGDLLQTALASDETLGETWRFEARDPNTELTVNIQLPDAPLMGEMFILTDALPDAGWTAAVFNLQVENGSRFAATFQLPEDWKLISVSTPDNDSKISSWKMDDQVLSVMWQNPLTRNSPRQLRLVARTQVRRERVPFRLAIPQVRSASEIAVNYQILLPDGANLQLLEGEGWRLIEGGGLLPALSQFREAKERIGRISTVDVVTLRSAGDTRPGRILASITPREQTNLELGNPSITPLPAGNDAGQSFQSSAIENLKAQSSENGVSLELASMAGQSHQRDCVQQADLTFDRVVQLDQLNLSLSSDCRLSAVKVDGQAVTVFRTRDQITLPAEVQQATSIQLTYVTPTITQLLEQRSTIPLPQTSIPVRSFRWSLEIPAPQQLARVNLPGLFQLNEAQVPQRPMLFGPLSRVEEDVTFNPFSLKNWTQLFHGSEQQQEKASSRRTWQFVSPTVGPTAEFVTWNSALTRSYAWVALLACLMFGMTARQFRVAWLRKVSVLWVLLLIILVTQASQCWALVIGGMLAGSLLSLILPRRWLLQRDLLSPTPVIMAKRIAVTSGSLLLAFCLGMTPVSYLMASNGDTEDFPVTLIRSVRYELLKWSPVPQMTAIFEVLVKETPDDVYLRLPLQDVVLPSEASCLVNGAPQPLIPATSGDAVLIKLGSGKELPGDVISGTDWRRCEIKLTFSIRTFESPVEGGTSTIRGVVPRVLDSVLTLPADLAPLNWQRFGEMSVQPNRGAIVQLGPIGRLALASGSANNSVIAPAASIHTAMDVSALRIRCLSRIQPGPGGWSSRLPLTFPPGSLVSNVSGANVIDTIDTSTAEDPAQLTVRLRTTGPALPISLSYEFPANSVSGTDVTIPAIKLMGGTPVPNAIGISGPPLTTMTLPNRTGQTPLTVDEWQVQAESGRPRPTLALLLKTPIPFNIEWTRKRAQRAATIQEELRIRRDTVAFTAVVKMSVTDAPTFRHHFQLDPAVHLESVTSGQMGNDGAVRFTRSDKLVTLYLAGGQMGDRVFHFKGHLSSPVDLWNAIPEITPMDTTVSERQLTILDETGWDIELESAAGTAVALAEDQTATSPAGLRQIGVFREGETERPRRMRISVPPRSIQSEIATLVQPIGEQEWEQVSTIHVASPEAPLKKVVIQLPTGLKNLRVRPSLFQHAVQTHDQQSLLIVRIPERYASHATFAVSGRYSSQSLEPQGDQSEDISPIVIPQIQILSAATASQYLLLETDSPMQPIGLAQLNIDALPQWIPPEWRQKVQSKVFQSFQQSRPEIRLQKRPVTAVVGKPMIRLEETALWAMDSRRLNGITRWWFAPQGSTELHLPSQEGVSINMISIQGSSLPSIPATAAGTTIPLPAGQGLVPITLSWTASKTNGELQLLKVDTDAPVRRLISVVHPRNSKIVPGNERQIPRFSAVLDRWESLLTCLHSDTYSEATSSLLLQNVEQSVTIAEQLSKDPLVSETQMNRYQTLTRQWQQLQLDLTPIQERPEVRLDASDLLFSEIQDLSKRGLPIDWFSSKGDQWSAEIVVTQTGIQWRRLFGALAVLALVAWILWKFPQQFAAFRETASSHPGWTFTLFGAVWWLWFSPSIFGLAIMLLTWIIAGIQRLRRRPPAPEALTVISAGISGSP